MYFKTLKPTHPAERGRDGESPSSGPPDLPGDDVDVDDDDDNDGASCWLLALAFILPHSPIRLLRFPEYNARARIRSMSYLPPSFYLGEGMLYVFAFFLSRVLREAFMD